MMSVSVNGHKLTPSARLLIVDQQEDFIEFCRNWLEPEGYEVQAAHNHPAAEKLLEAELFDLAVIELTLPGKSGLELIDQLQENNLPISVIFSSAQDMLAIEQVIRAWQLDTVAFLKKPCQPETLLDTIRQALKPLSPHATYGHLNDLSLPNLISLSCHERKKACLELHHQNQVAMIYFEKGQIVHAVLGGQSGADAIFEALTWHTGRFTLTMGQSAPQRTIKANWNKLLMEGLKRLDESAFDQEQLSGRVESETAFWSPEADGAVSPVMRRESVVYLNDKLRQMLEDRLAQLDDQLVLKYILFITRDGRLLYSLPDQDLGEALSLAALAAGSFSATDHAAQLIAHHSEDNFLFRQSLHEGPGVCLYSARVDSHWILTIAFEPAETNLGLARQFTLQAAVDLEQLVAEVDGEVDRGPEIGADFDEKFRHDVDIALDNLFD